jgi:hypothetical protein
LPPSAVKTVRDEIFWQYSKLIAKSSGKTGDYGFTMSIFKKLQLGKVKWSSSIREYIRDLERDKVCIYCSNPNELSIDHLIPKSRGGPDMADNAILACRSYNSSKGDKGVYEWYGINRRNEIPRIVEGKYLKLLYTLHANQGTLEMGRHNLIELCSNRSQRRLCEEAKTTSKLTVYCLESVLLKPQAVSG